MAEANGAGEGNDHEEGLARLEAARRDMEDALVVMAHLESKPAARIKEHAKFVVNHQTAMQEFDEKLNSGN